MQLSQIYVHTKQPCTVSAREEILTCTVKGCATEGNELKSKPWG